MSLRIQVQKLERWARHRRTARDLTAYRDAPVRYAREVLRAEPWAVQREIARLLRTPPYRVLVKSSHSVGKTWAGAWLTSWWFDTMGPGSAVITTAPTHRDVKDLLWAEIRQQRQRAGLGGFRGTSAPELLASHNHFAKGFTAERGESFQGRHLPRMLFVYDEGLGIDAVFWRTTKTMFSPDGNHAWVVFGNPTDTTSEFYLQEIAGGWHTVTMSSLDHPNVLAQLAGRPAPYPGAVNVEQFEDWLADWSDPVDAGDANATDLEWPPGSGRWFRPGPEMEARALGRWPSQATYGVWSDAAWQAAVRGAPAAGQAGPADTLPELGCDVARHGDDYTEIHGRRGAASYHHERHNGWDTVRTAGRLIELCREAAQAETRRRDPAAAPVTPEQIAVKVDDSGVGGGVVDLLRAAGLWVVPVDAGTTALEPLKYPRRRDELWFSAAALAREGLLDLSALPAETLRRLRTQALAPLWRLDAQGRRQVEPKHDTKKRLRSSPDGMDALNLAYAPAAAGGPERVGSERAGRDAPRRDSAQERRMRFGR